MVTARQRRAFLLPLGAITYAPIQPALGAETLSQAGYDLLQFGYLQ